jgi:acetyl-CoA carboxylase biotin carboxyl carrier protein
MTNDEIKELIRLVQETGIGELEVQSGDNRVRIRNSPAIPSQEIGAPGVAPVSLNVSSSPLSSTPGHPSHAGAPADEENNTVVKSPIVGTYYDSPSPGSEPFVKVGDHVQATQVICIIESMKLMNEIEAEVSGTIVAKLVENGRPVEYGESLFSIRPS